VNEAGLIGVDDAIANEAVAIMTSQRDAAFVVGAAHEALGDDGFSVAQAASESVSARAVEDRDDALDGFRGVESVQRGETRWPVRRREEQWKWFKVAHFANEDNVRVLTEAARSAVEKSRYPLRLRAD